VSKKNTFVFTILILRVGRTNISLPNEFTYDDDDNDDDDDDDNSNPFSFYHRKYQLQTWNKIITSQITETRTNNTTK